MCGIDTRIAHAWKFPAATTMLLLDAVAPRVCISKTASVARKRKAVRARARCCDTSFPARHRVRCMSAACRHASKVRDQRIPCREPGIGNTRGALHPALAQPPLDELPCPRDGVVPCRLLSLGGR